MTIIIMYGLQEEGSDDAHAYHAMINMFKVWMGWLAGWEEEETGPLSRSGMTREGARGKPGELPASLYNEQSAACRNLPCPSAARGAVGPQPIVIFTMKTMNFFFVRNS